MRTSKKFRIVTSFIMLTAVIIFMYPMFLMLIRSFGRQGIGNYMLVFETVDIRSNLLNSIVIVTLTLIGTGVVTSLAAFAFSKLRFRGRQTIFVILLMGMMIPASATLFPLFQIVRGMGLVNHLVSLLGPYVAGNAVFNLIVLKNYYDSLPNELMEAARIDGAGTFRIFSSVFLPISKPGLSLVLTQTFLGAWNELQMGMTFINDPQKQTLSVVPLRFSQELTSRYPVEVTFACMVICTIPIVIFYLFAQKLMVSGITSGAVKG